MQDEYRLIAFLVIVGTLLILFLVSFVVFSVYAYRQKQHQYIKEKEEIRSLYEQEILKAQLEIKEQTLQTISQEIHDNLGQILSLVKLNLLTIEVQAGTSNEDKLIDSRQLLSRAIVDLRNLSKVLNTNLIAHSDLASSLQLELDLLQKTGLYQTQLQVEGFEKTLDGQKTLIIFRIAQEIFNNIIKHAKATRILVLLQYTDQDFVLTISDNGNGFEAKGHQETNLLKKGNGLANMHNRAQLIGARFELLSATGQGTQITVTLPM